MGVVKPVTTAKGPILLDFHADSPYGKGFPDRIIWRAPMQEHARSGHISHFKAAGVDNLVAVIGDGWESRVRNEMRSSLTEGDMMQMTELFMGGSSDVQVCQQVILLTFSTASFKTFIFLIYHPL